MSRSQRHANGGGKGNSEVAKVSATLPTHPPRSRDLSRRPRSLCVAHTHASVESCRRRWSIAISPSGGVISLISRKARVPNFGMFRPPPLFLSLSRFSRVCCGVSKLRARLLAKHASPPSSVCFRVELLSVQLGAITEESSSG